MSSDVFLRKIKRANRDLVWEPEAVVILHGCGLGSSRSNGSRQRPAVHLFLVFYLLSTKLYEFHILWRGLLQWILAVRNVFYGFFHSNCWDLKIKGFSLCYGWAILQFSNAPWNLNEKRRPLSVNIFFLFTATFGFMAKKILCKS